MPDTLSAALDYHGRGWSIIPIRTGDKKPAIRWKAFQTRRADDGTLRTWFDGRDDLGLAVVLGDVSGGLACRDFDSLVGYQEWFDAHPDLARTLPTVRTDRGRHVYFRATARQANIITLTDGELRLSRSFAVLPPSIRKSGKPYRWLLRPPSEIPVVDPAAAGFIRGTYTDTCNECIRPPVPATLEEAIESTLPTGPGQRNRRLFDFARALKCLCPESSPASLRQIVVDWHRRALPVIRTKDFRTTLQDFAVAWEAIKSTAVPMQPIIEAADRIGTPAIALHYPPNAQRLVRVCAVLQQQWGDRPFFLSVRKAGEIMGCHHNSAWRTLLELQFDRIIKLETTGTLKRRRASKWRYLEGNAGSDRSG